MADYCEPSDLYAFGFPRGAVPNPGRVGAIANATSNEIALDVHGFALDDEVQFRADAGGSLPGGLADATTYYAIPVTESSFKVAATPGGPAIDLTSDGENLVVIAPLPIAACIAWASSILDDGMPAHVVPLEAPYPPVLVATCAELAAWKLAAWAGSASKSLSDVVDAAQKRRDRWAKGVPLRGVNAPTTHTNTAVSATVPFSDARGWSRFGRL